MSECLSDWQPAPDRAEKVADGSSQAKGWVNSETNEVIVRKPLNADSAELPAYGVYFFLKVTEFGRGVNRSLLFRDDDATNADDRINEWLQQAETPANPERFDTAIDPEKVRREELSHVSSLRDWAHLTGADYHITEKIGSRRQSSGPVAIFSGSSRRGEGAYVALASEDGSRGKQFASVGYRPNGHYETDQSSSQTAFEVESPEVEFDGGSIHIQSGRSSKELTVTATTDNPSHSLKE